MRLGTVRVVKLTKKVCAGVVVMLTDMWSEGLVGKVFATFMVSMFLLLLASPFLIYSDSKNYDAWATWCAEQGNTHIDTTEEIGVLPAGKSVVVTSDKTHYCLTADGRVLDIRD